MLGAQKTKLHGMKDARWTTKDKLTQYRGLVNLYTRERKVTAKDAIIKQGKQVEELRQLQKDIIANRAALDNEISGDRQKLRNTLANNRCMQLAFQNMPPIRVIDHVHQENFNKRKELDRISYQMDKKTSTLVQLKLELAMLEDRESQTIIDPRLPIEKRAATLTSQVQDALLKKQSAIQVREAYKNILAIMEKDAIYFDSVLDALKHDGISQGKCMFRCTELGQLATEYMDDVKAEFQALEKFVKKGMKERQKSLAQVKTEVTALAESLHYLINVENEEASIKRLPKTDSELELADNIELMEGIMMYMKNLTLSPSCENIFPNLESQLYQSNRLRAFRDKQQDEKERLSRKVEQARIRQENLYNSMIATTFDYKKAKENLKEGIEEKRERIKYLKDTLLARGQVMANIRLALQQLATMTRNVAMPTDKKQLMSRRRSSDSLIEVPTDLEHDAQQLINILTQRLTIIMREGPKPNATVEERQEAESLYQKHIERTSYVNKKLFSVVIQDTSLVEEVSMEDSYVFSRADIKAQSDELVKSVLSQSEDAQIAAAASQKKK